MNPLQQYLNNPKICIQCDTLAEAKRIGKYMEQLGGKDLGDQGFRKYRPVILFMEHVESYGNSYSDIDYIKSSRYELIHSSQIKDTDNEPTYNIY